MFQRLIKQILFSYKTKKQEERKAKSRKKRKEKEKTGKGSLERFKYSTHNNNRKTAMRRLKKSLRADVLFVLLRE